eukprot:GILI01005608.1.p1 GENE.GILI01005608.1~~GILI01005608.1.p1  ORF type:complete len:429 (-),score=128.75 GILI01005608.1:215-1501(-)
MKPSSRSLFALVAILGLLSNYCVYGISTRTSSSSKGGKWFHNNSKNEVHLTRSPSFKIIVFGANGGLTEDNLSSYAVTNARSEKEEYVLLDGGSIHPGMLAAKENRFLRGSVDEFMTKKLKAALVSHSHLDHLSGLIIDSTEWFPKPAEDERFQLYAQEYTICALSHDIFNNRMWPNFFGLNMIKPHTLPVKRPVAIQTVGEGEFKVTTFPVCHGNAPPVSSESNCHGSEVCFDSSAFLLEHTETKKYILYFGDVGPFHSDRSKDEAIWQEFESRQDDIAEAVAPHIDDQNLKLIFMENSYQEPAAPRMVFGHLIPSMYVNEIKRFACAVCKHRKQSTGACGECPAEAEDSTRSHGREDGAHVEPPLDDVTFVVSHIKPFFAGYRAMQDGVTVQQQVQTDLETALEGCGPLCEGVKLLIPRLGQKINA